MIKNDLTCTEPEQWASVPRSDAREEEIVRYLEHVEKCPLHSALERDESEVVQKNFQTAVSMTKDEQLSASSESNGILFDNFERYLNFRQKGQKVTAILLKTRSIADKRLNLLRGEQIDFDVTAPCSIQVWALAGSRQEILLATHVVSLPSGAETKNVKSFLSVQRDQSLIFNTQPLGQNRFRVSVTAESPEKVSLSEWLRFDSLFAFLRPRPALLALLVVGVLIGSLLLGWRAWRARNPTERAGIDGGHKPTGGGNAPVIESVQPAIPGNPELTVVLNDGGVTVGLDRDGRVLGLPVGLSPGERQLIEEALKRKSVSVAPLPGELKAESDGRMGGSSEATPLTLISPIQRIVISRTPTLRWSPLPGAAGYKVKVFDSDYNLVSETRGHVTKTSWKIPRTEALKSGESYIWKVVATKDGVEVSSSPPAVPGGTGRLTEAKFKVLESSKAKAIARASNAFPGSHLLLGLMYARVGLIDEADREFAALVRANPGSTLAQALLNDVRLNSR